MPRIHVGVGGWTFEPWRDNFYPAGLPHSRELHYASRQLTAIEVNGTFYSTFKPDTFAKWRDETPDGFVFSLKAHRFTTHRKDLGTAQEGVDRFTGSGIAQLGDKLGPLVWQFMPTKRFVAEEVESFLKLLPREVEGRPLRHVLDVRHESFATEEYLELLARHGCTTVYTDSPKFPAIPHAKSELAYLRLMRSEADCATGYAPEALRPWVEGAKEWAEMGEANEAFVYFINGAKERAPAAAMEFLKQLG
ncbi:DUF72 domain-containing protein [Ramlibacter sp. USB13]|uniref:DUF72 domain-containing protein n=1 Tax=Ramlibacter cellulosilyticus TaxID=2764187 RepID=A0A923MR64_9BURK|nr:DUF72 domain-containing protein [Ramlibacter cellulosilyticus]MBC5782704.1 DUF72 domain-containing protein [Ramlibacter cellulosilyticus]